jgi:hypothetical protein
MNNTITKDQADEIIRLLKKVAGESNDLPNYPAAPCYPIWIAPQWRDWWRTPYPYQYPTVIYGITVGTSTDTTTNG